MTAPNNIFLTLLSALTSNFFKNPEAFMNHLLYTLPNSACHPELKSLLNVFSSYYGAKICSSYLLMH